MASQSAQFRAIAEGGASLSRDGRPRAPPPQQQSFLRTDLYATSESEKDLPPPAKRPTPDSQSLSLAGSEAHGASAQSLIDLDEQTDTLTPSSSTKKSKQAEKMELWKECFEPKGEKYSCPFQPEVMDKNGHLHTLLLSGSPDLRVYKNHMERWHQSVHDAVEYAMKHNYNVRATIQDLKQKHAAKEARSLKAFASANLKKPDVVDVEIALNLWIADAGLPYHCFELPSFQNFLSTLNCPKLDSPDTWAQRILPPLAHLIENEVTKELRESFISISLDGWDSNSGKVLGAVAHYLSPSLQPKRHLLSVEPLNTNSTGPLLAASLKIQLQQKKLEKISALVSDNGGNYLNIASLLSVPGWNCSCHTLQLVVNEGLKGEFFFLFLFFLSLVFFFFLFSPTPLG